MCKTVYLAILLLLISCEQNLTSEKKKNPKIQSDIQFFDYNSLINQSLRDSFSHFNLSYFNADSVGYPNLKQIRYPRLIKTLINCFESKENDSLFFYNFDKNNAYTKSAYKSTFYYYSYQINKCSQGIVIYVLFNIYSCLYYVNVTNNKLVIFELARSGGDYGYGYKKISSADNQCNITCKEIETFIDIESGKKEPEMEETFITTLYRFENGIHKGEVNLSKKKGVYKE